MEWITLNVGGTQFSSQRSTLTSETTSNLARMVNAESKPYLSSCMECCTNDVMQNTMSVSCSHMTFSEEEPIVKIDCDPAAFSVILNYLRHRVIAIPPYVPLPLVKATASSLGLIEMGKKLEEFEKKDQTNNKEWLKLNVGGQIFETTRSTLTSHPTSSLAKMFQPNSPLSPALMEGGVYQVDACPRAFGVILNWLRYRQLILGNVRAKEVVPVADFFHIVDLSEALGECLTKEEDQKEAEREALENTTDRMENVLENIQGEISSCADKLKDIRGECSNVATNLEDIWRIKCELSNLVTATKAQHY